jgi:hypothetical protein
MQKSKAIVNSSSSPISPRDPEQSQQMQQPFNSSSFGIICMDAQSAIIRILPQELMYFNNFQGLLNELHETKRKNEQFESFFNQQNETINTFGLVQRTQAKELEIAKNQISDHMNFTMALQSVFSLPDQQQQPSNSSGTCYDDLLFRVSSLKSSSEEKKEQEQNKLQELMQKVSSLLFSNDDDDLKREVDPELILLTISRLKERQQELVDQVTQQRKEHEIDLNQQKQIKELNESLTAVVESISVEFKRKILTELNVPESAFFNELDDECKILSSISDLKKQNTQLKQQLDFNIAKLSKKITQLEQQPSPSSSLSSSWSKIVATSPCSSPECIEKRHQLKRSENQLRIALQEEKTKRDEHEKLMDEVRDLQSQKFESSTEITRLQQKIKSFSQQVQSLEKKLANKNRALEAEREKALEKSQLDEQQRKQQQTMATKITNSNKKGTPPTLPVAVHRSMQEEMKLVHNIYAKEFTHLFGIATPADKEKAETLGNPFKIVRPLTLVDFTLLAPPQRGSNDDNDSSETSSAIIKALYFKWFQMYISVEQSMNLTILEYLTEIENLRQINENLRIQLMRTADPAVLNAAYRDLVYIDIQKQLAWQKKKSSCDRSYWTNKFAIIYQIFGVLIHAMPTSFGISEDSVSRAKEDVELMLKKALRTYHDDLSSAQKMKQYFVPFNQMFPDYAEEEKSKESIPQQLD